MALVKMTDLMKRAAQRGTGVGTFSAYSMEDLIGILRAAEETRVPVIIQLAEGRFKTAPLELVGPMMVNAAKVSDLDIAVHLDHASTFAVMERALELGFTSIMYDGSAKPFEENIANTRKAKEIARRYGADIEAELGLVGKSESGEEDYGVMYTVPEDAKTFAKETGVDALAVAIGNQHGNYRAEPKLRFDILEEIHALIPETPLVLHGGSGISDADFQRCIRSGIRKVNVATALLNNIMAESKDYLTGGGKSFYEMSARMADGAYRSAKHHIEVFEMKEL